MYAVCGGVWKVLPDLTWANDNSAEWTRGVVAHLRAAKAAGETAVKWATVAAAVPGGSLAMRKAAIEAGAVAKVADGYMPGDAPVTAGVNRDVADTAATDGVSRLARHLLAWDRLQLMDPWQSIRDYPPANHWPPPGPVGPGDIPDDADSNDESNGDDNGDDNDDESDAKAWRETDDSDVASIGPYPFSWAARDNKLTQKEGGYVATAKIRAPPGAELGAGDTDPLFPHESFHKSRAATNTWREPFSDTAIKFIPPPSDPQNTYSHMLRAFDTAAEASVLGSHFGTVAGAVALYIVGARTKGDAYVETRHGQYMKSIYTQYSQHRAVYLHASALASAAIAAASKSSGGATPALATYKLTEDTAGNSEYWFPPPGGCPGLMHRVSVDGRQIGVLQLIPDLVLVTRRHNVTRVFVVELKTRHSDKLLHENITSAYWRQALIQGVQRWAVKSSANAKFRPGGKKPPRVYATLLVSRVTGATPTSARTDGWQIEVTADVARRVYATMLLHSTEDDLTTEPAGQTKRVTYVYDGTAGVTPVMDKDRPHVFSDVGIAAIADLLGGPDGVAHCPYRFARMLTATKVETTDSGVVVGWSSPTTMTSNARAAAKRAARAKLTEWGLWDTYKAAFNRT
jgi:hypothetical protein